MIVGTVKQLTAELVTRFGTLKAKKKDLDKEEKKVVPEIKDLMREDTADIKKTVTKTEDGRKQITRTYAPKKSPYMLVLTKYQKMDVSWKAVAQELFAEAHGTDADVESTEFKKAWQKFEDKFELKWEEKLECETNPDYKA